MRVVPKTVDGVVEMLRVTKVTKDNAVKTRSSAIISLRQVLVNAPDELRQSLQGLPHMTLIRWCAELRSGPVDNVLAATKNVLRAVVTRWVALDEEIHSHDHLLATNTGSIVLRLVDAFRIGADVAVELVIMLGENPERVRSPVRHQSSSCVVGQDEQRATQPEAATGKLRWPSIVL